MNLHIPALPGQPVEYDNSICVFTQKVRLFARMMQNQGYHVILYGDPRHDVIDGVDYVPCYEECSPVPFHESAWAPFNEAAVNAIQERMTQDDIVCMIGGNAQSSLYDSLHEHVICTEFGIGHAGSYAEYRVFESYAWMHATYGSEAFGSPGNANGSFYDAVIPAFFDPDEFTCHKSAGDYLLYIGRLTERKGIKIAEETARLLKKPLYIVGEGEYEPEYGQKLGVVGPEKRNELLADAIALLAPTTYLEPFGYVVIEANMCGTPAITTDWGAFTETVIPGINGFRCRTLEEFATAVCQTQDLSAYSIRSFAEQNYSLDAIGPLYNAYFDQLGTLQEDGWYSTALPHDLVQRYRRPVM